MKNKITFLLSITLTMIGTTLFGQNPTYEMIPNPNGTPGAFVIMVNWPANSANTNVQSIAGRVTMRFDAAAGTTPTVTSVQGTWAKAQSITQSTIDPVCGAANNPNGYYYMDFATTSTTNYGNVSAGATDTLFKLQFATTTGVGNIELLEGINGSGGDSLDNCLTGLGAQATMMYRPDASSNYTTKALNQSSAVMPLPVDLVAFNAKWHGEHVAQVNWATMTEINNSHFEVERSLDGKTFTKIDEVNSMAASGNSRVMLNYQILDPNLRNVNTVFYRLQQVDFDGSTSYSNVVVLHKAPNETLDVELYPTLADGILNFKINNTINRSLEEDLHISILNSLGQVMMQDIYTEVNTANIYNINLSALRSGAYYLNLSTPSGIISTSPFFKLSH